MEIGGSGNEYRITIKNRRLVTVEGVVHVSSFDAGEIRAETKMGSLLLKGEGLDIVQLDLEAGIMEVGGQLNTLTFDVDSGNWKKKSQNWLERILK